MSDAREQQPPAPKPRRWMRWREVQATPMHRALLLTALGGLLIAGISTALPAGADSAGRLVGISTNTQSGRASATFDKARPGDCLNWPSKSPDQASIVDCKDDHRFEVAQSVNLGNFPGSEYGPNAAAPSPARIQQISQEECVVAAKKYLGAKYDPNSRFVPGMLWAGEKAWSQSGERQMLCGLQLPGAKNEQQVFKGRVADLDQSKVWPAGTCIGIEPSTNMPTDTTVDCASPHAMEVTGSVNLAERFPDALPAQADQDAYLKDECTHRTDAYLAPVQLRATTLTLTDVPIALPSWSAGSRQVACLIGATLGNGGWSTLVGSAKGPLLINGQKPLAPPDIPPERLNLPPIPLPTPTTIDMSGSQQGQQAQQAQSPANDNPTIGTQHLPNAPGPQTPYTDGNAPASPPAPNGQAPGPGAGPPQDQPAPPPADQQAQVHPAAPPAQPAPPPEQPPPPPDQPAPPAPPPPGQ